MFPPDLTYCSLLLVLVLRNLSRPFLGDLDQRHLNQSQDYGSVRLDGTCYRVQKPFPDR